MTHKLFLFSLCIIGCSSKTLNIFDGKEFANVEFVKNYDGDTLTVRIGQTEIPVRVRGIDTPEIKTKDYCEGIKRDGNYGGPVSESPSDKNEGVLVYDILH